MKSRLPLIIVAALLPFLASSTPAEELVREFSGTRTVETADFKIKAPWLIDWRVNSDYPASMGLTVVLLHSPAGIHAGTVMKTKYVGNGLRLMEEGGRFRFNVDAVVANWTIKVIQLTPEEAEMYTPREKGAL